MPAPPALPSRAATARDPILDSVGIGVLTIGADDTLLEINDAALAMFGHTREALLGENVAVLMSAEHAARHDDYVRHHLRTGERRVLGHGRRVQGRRADGSLFPMHLSVGRFDSGGQACFTGIVHDLSEAESDHESVTRLGQIVEGTLNEIYVFAADTLRFTIVNESAAANLGYTRDELLALTPLDIKPLFDREGFERLLAPLRSGTSDRLRFETVHERKDGTRYEVGVTLRLSNAVAPPEFVAIIEDISERKRMLRALQQSQKMEAVGQLTGGIAHDFNNLLTVVGGNLELLGSDLDAADARELLEEAREAVSMGARLTARLLSFASKSEVSPETLDLEELVLGLAELLRRSLGESVTVELALAPRTWPVEIDRSLAENALMNLAINARDAMGGHGRLAIATANIALDAHAASLFDLPSGDYVTLSVSDDGAGIAPEDLGRVFEPFFTSKSRSGGHGLGLSTVYGFARQCGGHVTVESEPGAGACFTLYVPRTSARAAPVPCTPAPHARARARRVLVVEDDARVRRLTLRRLRRLGYEPIEANDARAALAAFRAEPHVDLVLTDMVMPGERSGLELARSLRREVPTLPVLIVSGHSGEPLALDALRAEGIVWLRKPHDIDALGDAIEAAERALTAPDAGR